jgi:methionyl aminopeptidase
MIFYKTKEEIELLRASNQLVGRTHAEVAKRIQPGVTTKILDAKAEEFIRDNSGIPAFKGYNGFPATLCISINDEVVHGIPGKREIKDGDIVSIDCGIILNEFVGDSAYTYPVGEVTEDALNLLKVTKECLYKGIDMAVTGNRIGDIGYAVQQHAESFGYSVVRELVGHGVGRSLHEKPEVPNFGKRGNGTKLAEGMTLAIEPMINAGEYLVATGTDNWTVSTLDQSMSAHFEHTVAIGKEEADILSTFEYIEKAMEENINVPV